MDKTKVNTKILMLSPLPPPIGGIASWTKKYIEWSKTNHLEVEIINTAVVGSRAQVLNKKWTIIEETKRSLSIFKQLNEKLEDDSDYITHLNTPCGNFGLFRDYLIIRSIKKRNIPIIIHYRCNIEDQIRKNIAKNYLIRKLANLADKNIVLNTPSMLYIKDISKKDVQIVSNFINEDYLLKKEKKINKEIKKIIFVGHVQETKGFKEILSVAKVIPLIEFEIIGPVSEKLLDLEVPNNLKLLGVLNQIEIREKMLDADIFLFPTYTEGFSNALLEAMAVGLPVITTNVGANKDMIESSGGIVIEPKNENAIIAAIEEMKDVKLRKAFSEWNIIKVERNYGLNNIMEEIKSIYQSII